MEILKNNNYFKITCSRCRSELGIHKEDIVYNEIVHKNSTFEVTCAACQKIIGLSSAIIPQSWIRDIVPDDSGH